MTQSSTAEGAAIAPWRKRAGQLLIIFVILDVALFAYTHTIGVQRNHDLGVAGTQIAWMLVDVFLAWRIWRGGVISWISLIFLNVALLALMIIGGTWPPAGYTLGLAAFLVAQLAALTAPAVRRNLQRRL